MKTLLFVVILGGILYGVYALNNDLAGLAGGGETEYKIEASRAAGQAVDTLRRHESTNKTEMDKALGR